MAKEEVAVIMMMVRTTPMTTAVRMVRRRRRAVMKRIMLPMAMAAVIMTIVMAKNTMMMYCWPLEKISNKSLEKKMMRMRMITVKGMRVCVLKQRLLKRKSITKAVKLADFTHGRHCSSRSPPPTPVIFAARRSKQKTI